MLMMRSMLLPLNRGIKWWIIIVRSKIQRNIDHNYVLGVAQNYIGFIPMLLWICMCQILTIGCGVQKEVTYQQTSNLPIRHSIADLSLIHYQVVDHQRRRIDQLSRLDQLTNEPIIIHFFTTWCDPCTTEIPTLNQLHKDLKGKATILGLCLEGRRCSRLIDYKRLTDIRYMTGAIDHILRNLDRAIGGIDALPTTLVIDRNKRVFGGALNLC